VNASSVTQRYVAVGSGTPDGARYENLPIGLLRPNGTFLDDLRRDARLITDPELDLLLRPGGPANWRSRMVAGYLIALDRRARYRDTVRDLLLATEVVYSGESYCFALVAFGTHRDAEILAEYLDRYLSRTDLRYDQACALGALRFLDGRLGTAHAARYLADGSWDRWARVYPNTSDPAREQAAFETLHALL
jgi:hypothetical protein